MIELQHVSFSYPDSTDGGLRDVTLTIPDGQCVLLCGRSGCGKTTLTRLINGLIPQFFSGELTGRVLLDGEDVSRLPLYRIAERVGSVFQNPRTQFFNVDADSEIAFGLENEAVPQTQMAHRVAETAQALRIEELLGRSIFALSGGEKQKIAFASVYAMNPSVYLLDEPSSNLDMASIDALREHLRLIKAQGKTVIVAEHRLYYLLDVADRVIWLEDGRVAGDWTPEQLRALGAAQRQKMGLRAIDLTEERPAPLPPSDAAPVLALKNVTLGYQKRPVLENVSLQAAPGEVIAVVGHNGAGGTYDCIAILSYYVVCKAVTSFREIEEMEENLILPTFRRLKFVDCNKPFWRGLMYKAFASAKAGCDRWHDYEMHVAPFEKDKPIYYEFTACPAAEFAIRNGLTDIMPALCNVDYVSMELIHARLVRTTTCANGCKCDYTICGDRDDYLKEHPEYRDEAGYRRNV